MLDNSSPIKTDFKELSLNMTGLSLTKHEIERDMYNRE